MIDYILSLKYGHNILAIIGAIIFIVGEVEIINWLRRNRKVNVETSRKLTHILTGPLFLLLWSFFDNSYEARYFAVIGPSMFTVKFIAVGLGLINDPDTVNSLSRTGNKTELLKGPGSYGIIFIVATIVWWRTSVQSIVSLMILCAGDGMAGLIGPIYGKTKLPWNKQKSYVGSLTFLVFSFVLSMAFIHWFWIQGWIIYHSILLVYPVLYTCIICTLVESLPVDDWDNVTVFIAGFVSLSLMIQM